MYHCPNCGGSLRFDILSQLLKCDHCSTTFDPYSVSESLLHYFLKRDVLYISDSSNLVLDGRPGWRSIDNFFPVEPMRIGLPLIVSALAILGVGEEQALKKAWEFLNEKKDTTGRLLLEGTLTKQPCKFGKVGKENKWVTFYSVLA